MRDRLIELLLADVECDKDGQGDCSECEYKSSEDECVKHLATLLADHLLANGVIVPESRDVVEVVRCKDCDVPHNRWTGCPNLNGMIPPPDFYCARGERK